MPSLLIDGQTVEAPEGTTILEAVARLGDRLPSVCHDPRIRPVGGCRLCLVDIKGEPRLLPACTTKVREGMVVTARSKALERFRRRQLEWYAARLAPEVVAAHPEKELHRLLRRYGVEPAGPLADPTHCDASVPNIRVDLDQCIHCLRCVRICDELQGQMVWHALGRGADIQIVPAHGSLMLEGGCVSCGACADSCPTGALIDARAERPESWTRTVCPYCGVGCELEVGSRAGRVVAARPVLEAPVNKGHLCAKGRYGLDFVHAPDRLLQPQLRAGGVWRPTTWDAALNACAAELARIRDSYGAQAVGVLGSARATNEENYLAQKFARLVLGSNNVDCCARVCHTPSAKALKTILGTGAATNSFDDIEAARTILIVGANPLECHPVVGARIRQQVLRCKAELVVIDPRRTELAQIARLHLPVRPGTDIPLLNAMANVIVREGLVDKDFVQRRVDGFEAFAARIAEWTPERAAGVCGVPVADIADAARLYATAKPAFCAHGLGVTEHVQGSEAVMTLVNLALLTGNLGRAGAGVNPLRGQNNVQGAAHMGCDPGILTGSVAIERRRSLFEAVWGAPPPSARGLNLMQMIDAAAAGRLKALWVMGYDVLATLAQERATMDALGRVELLIVQDLFMTETARAFGHVLLPAAATFEKNGTFMNSERRIQRVRRAIAPPGAARSDWEIICALAQRMGHGGQFSYANAEEIWEEIRRVWPEGAGISYARLDESGLQWPCRDESDPGTTVLHVDAFACGPRAALRPVDYAPTPEAVDADYPFLLTTGRSLYQFNVGDMSRRTANVQLRPTDILDISPVDGRRLGLADGDPVRVTSRYGAATLPVRLDKGVAEGQAFATFHDPKVHLNRVTGPHRDALVGAPEYKVTAVRIERDPGEALVSGRMA
jgi:formate dehydrogenase major subunit